MIRWPFEQNAACPLSPPNPHTQITRTHFYDKTNDDCQEALSIALTSVFIVRMERGDYRKHITGVQMEGKEGVEYRWMEESGYLSNL